MKRWFLMHLSFLRVFSAFVVAYELAGALTVSLALLSLAQTFLELPQGGMVSILWRTRSAGGAFLVGERGFQKGKEPPA